jgi:hypothetical protein
LHEDVERDAVLVDRAPEIMLLAVDPEKDLIQVPDVAWPGPPPAQLVGNALVRGEAKNVSGFLAWGDIERR